MTPAATEIYWAKTGSRMQQKKWALLAVKEAISLTAGHYFAIIDSNDASSRNGMR